MRRMIVMFGALLAIAAQASAAAPDPSVYEQAVADPARLERDRQRDAREKPVEVLAFAGFAPGMRVADIFAGGGYYSELIADVVGPGGSVLMLNNSAYQNFAREELKERLEGRALVNVNRMTIESCNLRLGINDLDAALIVMSYHDLYYADDAGGWAPIDAGQFLDQIHAALKPGGFFLIIDHAAKPGTGKTSAQELHRIDEAFAKLDIESHGFKLEKTYDGLRNAGDDPSKLVFDPAVRGKTDRFVHLYRRL